MSGRAEDHRTRMQYDGFVAALQDADQVVAELTAVTDGRLLVTREEVEFSVRRARQLIRSCIHEANTRGIG